MKKLIALLLLLISVQLFAQSYPITGITISLPANPDAMTTNWSTGTSLFIITATAKGVNGRVDAAIESSKILVTIKKSGSKICGAYTSGSAPSASFNALTKVWRGSSALSLLGQECTLPPGEYDLCVQFFGNGPTGLIALSEEKCKAFSIRANEQQNYQAPQAIMPTNGALLNESDILKPITFRWTPVVPKPQEPSTYRLKVWQLMQGQNGTQAMKANQPIITKDVDNLTQATVNNLITGPCKPPYLCDFIWNVQAINRDGKPIGGNNGTSESLIFSSKATEETIAPPKLRLPANSETIATGKQPLFTWLAPTPTPTSGVTYKIKIVEIKGDQSPENALRTNKPFFEKDSLEILKFQYPSSARAFETGRTYAWGVQAFNRERKTVGSNDGRSNIFSFKALATPGSCDINIDSINFICKGYSNAGFPIYGFKIYLKNNSSVGTTYLGHTFTTNTNGDAVPPTSNGNYLELFNSIGTISSLAPTTTAVTIIPQLSQQIITGTYTLNNWVNDSCFRFKVWASTLITSGTSVSGNACSTIKDTCLTPCICTDCDKAVLNATSVQAIQVSGNPSQYNISGNFSFSGLPQNVQAVEVQVQTFNFSNSPDACSNGVQSVATSGVLVNPSTTINSAIPIFQNVTVLNNTNISKNVKLIIGGSGLPQPTSIPFNLTVGVPAPLPGLPADCCKIEYEMCFKVIVYYGSSPGKCKYCEFIFCKSFSNK